MCLEQSIFIIYDIEWHYHSTTSITYEIQHYRLFSPKNQIPLRYVSFFPVPLHYSPGTPRSLSKNSPRDGFAFASEMCPLKLVNQGTQGCSHSQEGGHHPSLLLAPGPPVKAIKPRALLAISTVQTCCISRCPYWNCSQGSVARNTPKATNPSPVCSEPFNHF